MFAVVPIDWQLTDTYYVVAHHSLRTFRRQRVWIVCRNLYWFPKIQRPNAVRALGKWHFWLTFFGFNLTFMVQHPLGNLGCRAAFLPIRIFLSGAS